MNYELLPETKQALIDYALGHTTLATMCETLRGQQLEVLSTYYNDCKHVNTAFIPDAGPDAQLAIIQIDFDPSMRLDCILFRDANDATVVVDYNW